MQGTKNGICTICIVADVNGDCVMFNTNSNSAMFNTNNYCAIVNTNHSDRIGRERVKCINRLLVWHMEMRRCL